MITKVTENIYRGPMPDFDALQMLGIKSIVGLQNGGDNEELGECLKRKITYYDFDLPGFWPPSQSTLLLITKTISEASTQPVYVHCRHGRERTGLIIAAYRMEYMNWFYDAALAEMIQMGSRIPYQWFARLSLMRIG